MLPGPIFRREMRDGTGRRVPFGMRIALATFLGVIAIVPALIVFRVSASYGIRQSFDILRDYWHIVFAFIVGVEIACTVLWTPGAVSSSIAQEREKDTLPLLLLTRLTRFELVATKLAGRLMPPFMVMSGGLPLLLFCGWCAGVSGLLICEILVVSTTSVVVAGSLAILASARRERSVTARQEAAGWNTLWFFGFPILSRIPARGGALWSDLLVEIRRLASWIALSSPLSILTDQSWLARASLNALSNKLLLMVVLQLVLIVLALWGAVASLRLREPHPRSWDAHGGYRPPVSDDPIFWREYVLPWRGSRVPAVVLHMRYMWITIRAIIVMLLQLAVYALSIVVPLAMLISVGWFGGLAFEELWTQRSFTGGIYQARDRFNLCIRAVTAMLGVIPLMSLPSFVTARFTSERDAKTWESLLMTSLTGPEIISAKTRATARGFWSVYRWLVPLWVLGVACGSVHPVGAVLAGAGLPVLAGAGLALGTWAGIRPGSTTRAATSASSFWSLGLMIVGGLVVIAPLCSVREFAIFWSWDGRLRWPIVVMVPALLVSVGFFARSLSRRCAENFDVCVGRPHRDPAMARTPKNGPAEMGVRASSSGSAGPTPARSSQGASP
jgi:hypothetical protein